uniref:Arrestin_N domain-containing protein n=1 Tax=Parastrongyloides trichosuri TaxID=131310 RepID=A0A0N5A1T4_PARTI
MTKPATTYRFEIKLDCEDSYGNQVKDIYPGQPIKGEVIGHFDNRIDVENITIILNGVSKVGFSKKKDEYITCPNDYDSEAFQKYSSILPIVKKEQQLYKAKKKEKSLGPGTKKWNFIFPTDKGWPATFTGHMGKIKYYLICNVDMLHNIRYSCKKKVKLSSYATHKDMTQTKKGILKKKDFQIQPTSGKVKDEHKLFVEVTHLRNSYYMNDVLNYSIKLKNMTDMNLGRAIISLKQDKSFEGLREEEHSGMPEEFRHTRRAVLAREVKDLVNVEKVTAKGGGSVINLEGALNFKDADPDFNFKKGNIDTKTFLVVEVEPPTGVNFANPVEIESEISIKNIPEKNSIIQPLRRKKFCC